MGLLAIRKKLVFKLLYERRKKEKVNEAWQWYCDAVGSDHWSLSYNEINSLKSEFFLLISEFGKEYSFYCLVVWEQTRTEAKGCHDVRTVYCTVHY